MLWLAQQTAEISLRVAIIGAVGRLDGEEGQRIGGYSIFESEMSSQSDYSSSISPIPV